LVEKTHEDMDVAVCKFAKITNEAANKTPIDLKLPFNGYY